nr:MAG TPA: DTW domain [Caudoviricetes sp.]
MLHIQQLVLDSTWTQPHTLYWLYHYCTMLARVQLTDFN